MGDWMVLPTCNLATSLDNSQIFMESQKKHHHVGEGSGHKSVMAVDGLAVISGGQGVAAEVVAVARDVANRACNLCCPQQNSFAVDYNLPRRRLSSFFFF